MKSRLTCLWALLAALLPALSIAQTASQDIFLDLRILNPDAQIFNIGDIDFTNTGAVPEYFEIQLSNNSPTNVYRIRLILQIILNGTPIAEGQTNPFNVPPMSNTVLNSQTLSGGSATVFDENGLPQRVELNFDDANIDLNAVTDLEDQILATGRAPFGTYAFILSGLEVDQNGNPLPGDPITDNNDNHTVFVTNPTTVELIFPGRSISESGDPQELSTLFPYFQWYSDVNPAVDRYNLSVWKRYPEDNTAQDVLNRPKFLYVRDLTQPFFQYPTEPNPVLFDGVIEGPARSLEPGYEYFWQVQSLVETSTGVTILESDIFRFRITSLENLANQSPQILSILEQLLGSNWESQLQQLRQQGFEPNGTIIYNGQKIEMNDLLSLLNKILQGEVKINKVEVY